MKYSTNRFYYLRHHRTAFHDAELMCGGGSDVPLSETSANHLYKYAAAIASHVKDIEIIYTTRLLRAKQTAEIINEQTNKKIQFVNDLAEWHLGDWEGKPWSNLPHPFTCELTPPSGEPRSLFNKRVRDCITKLLQANKIFLIVGHGIFFHELSTFLLGKPEYLETANLVSLEFDGSNWLCRELLYSSNNLKIQPDEKKNSSW
jgi:broad specificity phosphatase PhoE